MDTTIRRIENLKRQIIQQNEQYQQLLQDSKQIEARVQELQQNVNQVYPTYQAMYTRQTNLNAWRKQIEELKFSILDENEKIEPMRKKLKVLIMNDMYGEVTTANLETKIKEASKMLVKLDRDTAELSKKRENIIESCKECKSEISAIQNDTSQMKSQIERTISKLRKLNRDTQNEFEDFKIDELKRYIKQNSEILSESAQTSKAELTNAKNQLDILYQNKITKAITYALNLITPEVQSNEELHSKIREQFTKIISDIKELLVLPTKHDDLIKQSDNVTKTLIQDRNILIDRINKFMEEFEKLSVIKNKTIEEIDKYKMQIDIATYDHRKTKEQISQFQQQNNKLQKNIDDKIQTIDEQKKYISQIQEENQRIEKYSAITKENIAENKANLKNLKQKEIEVRNKYIESQKAIETYANKFRSTLILLLKEYQNDNQEEIINFEQIIEDYSKKATGLSNQISKSEYEYRSLQEQLQYQLSFTNYLLFNFNLSIENKITNLELIYSANPGRFTITKPINEKVDFLIVQNASPLFVSQALFYPENIDPIYPYTIFVSLICKYSDKERINILVDCLQSLKSYLSLSLEGKEIKNLGKAPYKFNDIPIPNISIEMISERTLKFISAILYLSPKIANNSLINPIILTIVSMFNKTEIKFSNAIHELLNDINKKLESIKLKPGETDNKYRIPKFKSVSIHFRKDNNTLSKLIFNLSINETYICEHLNFYHLILYRDITFEELISFLINKGHSKDLPASIQNILEEGKRIMKLIVSHIVQPDKEMMTTAFYRWVEIGEKAFESGNLFLFCSIYDGFNDTRITAPINENIKENDKYKIIYRKRKDALFDDSINTTNYLFKNSRSEYKIPDFTVETMFNGLLFNASKISERSNNLFNELAQRYFEQIKIINKKYKYQVSDDMIPMEFYRAIANEAITFLSNQNSEPEFQISEELFAAVKRA